MLVGHKKQWQFLAKTAEAGHLPHALLFYGQEHLGKKTFAIEFARYLNCFDKKIATSCGRCRNCLDIKRNLFPDFLIVEPEPQSKEIQISQIRGLIEKLSFKPYSSKTKIAVLVKAHLMSQEAQNCFLKFLEEPTGEALIVLITEHPYSLLPTILSRIQKIKFFPVGSEEIKNFLKEKGAGEKALDEILPLASGKPGLAIDFFEIPEKLKEREKFISDLGELASGDLAYRFKYADNISGESFDFAKRKEVLGIWIEYLRNLLLFRIGNEGKLSEKFSHYSIDKIKEAIKFIEEIDSLISNTNINIRLAFEILLMRL
jgi:DNA polymerase III subunit delta'